MAIMKHSHQRTSSDYSIRKTQQHQRYNSHTVPRQRRRWGVAVRCIRWIGIILLFILVIINAVILGYKLGQHIADDAEIQRLHDPHSIARESRAFIFANLLKQGNGGVDEDGYAEETKSNIIPLSNKSKPYNIAFLRIAKTGSTTLLTFINQKTSLHGLYTQIDENTNENHYKIGNCVFTHNVIFDGRNGLEKNMSAKDMALLRQSHDCYHSPYLRMTKEIQDLSQELQCVFSERWVSMIRDPFDRLVSLFYFSKGVSFNMYLYNSKQSEMIKNDDIQGWMETLTEEEYRYISEQHWQFVGWTDSNNDLEEALELIDGDQPTILTLISECFEASLRLFVEEFDINGTDTGKEVDIIQDFVTSSRFHERKRPQKYTNHTYDENELRTKAKEWFHDDFEFYAKAVEQFKQKMGASVQRSGGDEKHFETCKYYKTYE